ncbi:MAG: tetratricopeptide repeat protein [Deltaproteobacteria bacterium]|jgi:tetratricopeptide (TPR) repeat protein|nr:tetratricopeptide repeat protein [Deltaproteobacteria bacterium]
MGLLQFFSPKSFDVFEEKGDRLMRANDLGLAKLQYEEALSRLETSSLPNVSKHRDRIETKLQHVCESLALQHKISGAELVSAGCFEEAGELLELSRALTHDPQLLREVDALLADMAAGDPMVPGAGAGQETDDDVFDLDDEEAYFLVLCSTLADEIQEIYAGLGENFRSGYIALNRGGFEAAADLLNKALADQGGRITYVHLELATAYLNLGDVHAARTLLEAFIAKYPDALRAYEVLCEIYWEFEAYDLAETLLQSSPDTLQTSMLILLLMGETLFRSGKQAEAASFYLKSIEYLGWDEQIAVALARTYEAQGMRQEALAAYREILASCKSCRKRVDPFVRQRYAELMYETGDISSGLVETYFSLCRENPENQPRYFGRIGDIYRRQGYPEEARRYLEMARKGKLGAD